MIIVGSANSNRSELLVEEYIKLVQNGATPKKILFLTLNAYKKHKILKEIQAKTGQNANVQTFLGLCYNTVLNNWQEIEKHIQTGSPQDAPTLCGLEVSQNILLEAAKQVGFKDYNSKINLAHQLLRRHSLIVSNNLSDKDVEEKSAILGESFAEEAKKALDIFKSKTIELRAFDYIRQQSLFKYLYENTDVLSEIKFIFIDDYDEQTPACTDFFKNKKNQLENFYIGTDLKGSSRMGYLCADVNSVKISEGEKNIILASEYEIKTKFETKNFSKRLEMIQAVVDKIEKAVKNGTSPEEISIITPVFDNQLKFILESEFSRLQIPTQFISGSEKLAEINIIKSSLSVLRLINGLDVSIDDIGNILTSLLKIPAKYSCPILKKFAQSDGFMKYDFKNEFFNKKYEKFLKLNSKTGASQALTRQLDIICDDFISGNFSNEEIENFSFLNKQVRDLERTLYGENIKEKIITQLENSIIAENDIDSFKLTRNAIVIGTPQKIIDFDLKTNFQFWLDTSSDDWLKQDTGTIYNAWVFARAWKKNEFTYEDSIQCIKTKTERVLRKLKLLAKSGIFAYSSSYNSLGQENNLGISEFFKKAPETIDKKDVFKFTPRGDQKAILAYEGGKLAISAVPGAGKTTVLQALIAKLLTENTPPESIFVLTYMEAAAKNIKERILNAYPDLEVLPNITTIHGLALRIIKENGNYSKIGLAENFDICDDLQRQKLMQETISELQLKYDEYEKFEKGVSIAKYTKFEQTPKTKEAKEFLAFYTRYNQKLSEHNLIDYDDMLILSVKLLKNNAEILTHYQNLCGCVIEDEAQDSSAIQQELISLLSGKSGNIVRCGDLNQAITTTFTNADLKGFKKFISENTSVEMNHSQRCARGIFELANNLVDLSETHPDSTEAFYKIKMREVEGRNPQSGNPVNAKIFDSEEEEKNALISKIKDIFRAEPTATAAILVRNNFQVNAYSALLKENGIATLSRTDCLEQNSVFNTILSILKFCNEPWDNYLALDVYKKLFSIKEDNLFLTELKVPFITIDTGFISDEKLIQLHWELNFWLSESHKSYEYLSLKIGEYYSQNEIDRSNLFIIAEIIRRITSSSRTKKEITTKLEQLAKRPTISGLKLFSENDNTLSTLLGGKVQVMTMHKAKGDEFDFVFVPEFTEKSLGTDIKSIKIGDYSAFYEELKSLNPTYKAKSAIEIKKNILEENLRLLYVTITRTKLAIYFSCAKKYKKFGRVRGAEYSALFSTLFR